jgi:hypothetical protein
MRREFFGWSLSSRLNRIDSLVPARADQVIDYKSDVRFWPKADIPSCTAHVRFWGVKRT